MSSAEEQAHVPEPIIVAPAKTSVQERQFGDGGCARTVALRGGSPAAERASD